MHGSGRGLGLGRRQGDRHPPSAGGQSGPPARVRRRPGRPLEGRLSRIGHSATNQFALLPNPNPSGNFTKITQRIEVRIEIEDPVPDLRPGMMVEVEFDI
ncbi:MAG: hypothetical protein U5R48_11480 [Gammaproteobacteria bacterium]|nr:hypothetical protein [Gammaproteobacteria bacterium]